MSGPQVDKRCGSYAGYQAHTKRGDTPCADCRRAAAAYQADYRANGENRARERELMYARERAVWRLAKMHPGTYQALVDEESADIPDGRAKKRAVRMADCHPQRLHCAKGLCERCYNRQRHAAKRADPTP